jgi:uncharacterized protein
MKSLYNNFMELKLVSQLLTHNQAELKRYGVNSLSVFGSIARGDATVSSDLDVLVEFSKPVGLFEFIRLKKFLEDLIGCDVDLVTQDALHPAMRETILQEAIHVC